MSLLTRRHFLFGLAGFTLLPFAPPAEALYNNFKPFKFGFVTGSYLINDQPDSYKLLQESQLFLQDAVKNLNREHVDFVIFGGDNVEDPGADDVNWQLFIDVVQVLNCPWNFVLGEQDVSSKFPVDRMKTYGPDWKGKGIDSNKPYWSQDPLGGVHMIGLDTSQPHTTTGYLSKSQLDWLRADLNSNRNKFTIVVSHHPLLPPAPFDGGAPWDDYIVPQGATAREIMGQHSNVRLALSGNVHVSRIQQEKSVWHVSSPSLAVYPCAYRIFSVTPDYITVETYEISFPALIKKAKKEVENWSLPYKYGPKPQSFIELMDGTKGDQNARLPLVAGKGREVLEPKKRKEDKAPRQDDHEGKGLFKKKKKKSEDEEPKEPGKKEKPPRKEKQEKNVGKDRVPPSDRTAGSDKNPGPDKNTFSDKNSAPDLNESPDKNSMIEKAPDADAANPAPASTDKPMDTSAPDTTRNPDTTPNLDATPTPAPSANPAAQSNSPATANPATAPDVTPGPDSPSTDVPLKLRLSPEQTSAPSQSAPPASTKPAAAPSTKAPGGDSRTTPPKDYPPPVE